MQVNIGTEDGEVHQVESKAENFVGKEIGETFDGDILDLEGYELEITGGSDEAGFPMRESIEGSERERVLIEEGSGVNSERDGVRKRKSVRGKRVSTEIEQLNTKVVGEGSESLEELLSEDEE
jgi:small subunit ribosomal protein S6e